MVYNLVQKKYHTISTIQRIMNIKQLQKCVVVGDTVWTYSYGVVMVVIRCGTGTVMWLMMWILPYLYDSTHGEGSRPSTPGWKQPHQFHLRNPMIFLVICISTVDRQQCSPTWNTSQESITRIHHKNPSQESITRIHHKNPSQESITRIHHLNVLKGYSVLIIFMNKTF